MKYFILVMCWNSSSFYCGSHLTGVTTAKLACLALHQPCHDEVVSFGTVVYSLESTEKWVKCVQLGNKALVCFAQGNNIQSAVMSTQCVQQCKMENQTKVEQDQDHDRWGKKHHSWTKWTDEWIEMNVGGKPKHCTQTEYNTFYWL